MPQMIIIAPVMVVLKEVCLVVMQPDEDGVYALHGQAEITDRARVAFLYDVVLKHPVLHS